MLHILKTSEYELQNCVLSWSRIAYASEQWSIDHYHTDLKECCLEKCRARAGVRTPSVMGNSSRNPCVAFDLAKQYLSGFETLRRSF